MEQTAQVAQVAKAMVTYFDGDVRRINHFLKVYGFATTIGALEGLDTQTQTTLAIAALTHDIGIKVSEQKYQSASGTYQQLEGPPEARALLAKLSIAQHTIQRVCWLIAHHHTYDAIQGLDYQILVEADFLVNIHEDALARPAIEAIAHKIFRTQTGLALLGSLYLPGAAAAQ